MVGTIDIVVNGNDYNDGAYDAVNNPGGFANDGHRKNMLPLARDIMTASGGSMIGTSATSLTVGTGSKSFTLAAAMSYQKSQYIQLGSASDPTKVMFGQITAVAGAVITFNVTVTGGSGTATDWLVYPSGPNGIRGNTWTSAASAPGSTTGFINGDMYLNTVTGDVYQLSGGAWGSPIMNVADAYWTTRTYSSSGAITANHKDVIVANGSSAQTVNLPAAVKDRRLRVWQKNTGSDLTCHVNGTDTVNGTNADLILDYVAHAGVGFEFYSSANGAWDVAIIGRMN